MKPIIEYIWHQLRSDKKLFMAGDTLRLNHTVKDKNTYDAIIVGSGISGGWAAKNFAKKD
jgi:alkyl hydroperoxide reductase subunit AhpF